MTLPVDDIDIAPAAPASPITTAPPVVLDADVEVTPAYGDASQTRTERAEAVLRQEGQTLLQQAEAFTIATPEDFAAAGELIDRIKSKKRSIETFFKPMADAAHKAWTAITTRRALMTDDLTRAEGLLSGKYQAYKRRVEAEAAEERRRQEAAERERREREAREAAEVIAREAEAARIAAEQAGTREEAAALEERSEQLAAEAEAVRVEAVTAPAPVIPVRSVVADIKGPTVRANWTFEIDDKMALIKAVAAGQVSPEALEPNTVYLRARAKADKDTLRIPGVRFFDAGSVVASRGRR